MYVQAPVPAWIVAVPFRGTLVTANTLPSARPSTSLASSRPVITVSSAPLPPVSPPMVVASLPTPTFTVTVAVSVTPPEVTV